MKNKIKNAKEINRINGKNIKIKITLNVAIKLFLNKDPLQIQHVCARPLCGACGSEMPVEDTRLMVTAKSIPVLRRNLLIHF